MAKPKGFSFSTILQIQFLCILWIYFSTFLRIRSAKELLFFSVSLPFLFSSFDLLRSFFPVGLLSFRLSFSLLAALLLLFLLVLLLLFLFLFMLLLLLRFLFRLRLLLRFLVLLKLLFLILFMISSLLRSLFDLGFGDGEFFSPRRLSPFLESILKKNVRMKN